MGASSLKELVAVEPEVATSGKPQLNSKIYVEDDQRMDLILRYQEQAEQTPEYRDLQRIEREVVEGARAYWMAVDAEAMRMFKAHGAELFPDLDEAQQQRTANTVYRTRAQKVVGPAPVGSWEAKRALEDFVRAYLEAHMPERSPYADAARQHRDQQALESFKLWHAGSRVVDREGNPVIAFHSTSHDFDSFRCGDDEALRLSGRNPDYCGALGTWFAAPPLFDLNYDEGSAEDTAEGFVIGRDGISDYREGANIMPVYLAIKNPKEFGDYEDFQDERDSYDSQWEFKQAMLAAGHDGIVIRNCDTDGNNDRDDWVAFYPQQIKSAIGNSGKFDPASDSLTDAAPVYEKVAAPAQRRAPQSDAFKEWFGSSSVVDEIGAPLVVYHGTCTHFEGDGFSYDAKGVNSYGDADIGFFFGSAEVANAFTDHDAEGSAVIPAYLSINKPKYVQGMNFVAMLDGLDTEGWRSFKDKAIAAGYDGVIVRADDEARNSEYSHQFQSDNYIAFRPEQIKSAIGNSGAFDPSSPSLVDRATAPSATLPARSRTASEAFKRWFGQSQLVLPNGEPLRAFHGTNKDLDAFEPGGKAQAIFVTVDAGYASLVAETKGWGDGDNVIPVFVRAENPMYVAETEYSFDAIARAKLCGFDALITRADDGTFGRTIAVFSPHQLKSAVGNSGEFDVASPSLTDTSNNRIISESISDLPGLTRGPLVVYHGTNHKFDRFETHTLGAFFSSSPIVARAYGNFVVPAHLALRHPLVVNAAGNSWDEIPFCEKLSALSRRVDFGFEGYEDGTVETDTLARLAMKAGYDGLIVENVIDAPGFGNSIEPSVIYSAFDSAQIEIISDQSLERDAGVGVQDAAIELS